MDINSFVIGYQKGKASRGATVIVVTRVNQLPDDPENGTFAVITNAREGV